MRATLHIVPEDLAPIFHFATLRPRLAKKMGALRRAGLNSTHITYLEDAAIHYVSGRLVTNNDLIGHVMGVMDQRLQMEIGKPRRAVAANIVRLLWDKGIVAAKDLSLAWNKENRHFQLRGDCGAPSRLADISESDAITRLIDLYVSAYGPVSVGDICGWTGLPLSAIEKALPKIKHLGYYPVTFDCPPLLVDQRESLPLSNDAPDSGRAVFLSYEDPFLKGYWETRYRYADAPILDRVFHSTGEVRATILMAGRIVGVWNGQPHERLPKFTLFKTMKNSLEVDVMEAFDRFRITWNDLISLEADHQEAERITA